MTDFASGYMHVTPLRNKNQWSMVQEFLTFAGVLGYAELTFRCDNEPRCYNCSAMWSMQGDQWVWWHTKARHHLTHIPLVWLNMLWAESGRLLGPSHGRTACSLIFKWQSLVLGAQTCGMAHGSSMRRNSLENFAGLVSRRLDFQGWKAKALRNGGECCSLERRSRMTYVSCLMEVAWFWQEVCGGLTSAGNRIWSTSWLLHIGVGRANLDMAVGCFLRSLHRQRWVQVTLDQLAWSSQVRARTRTQRQFARNTWKRLNQWSFAIHDKVLHPHKFPRNMFQLTRSQLHCNLACWWWANQKIMIYVWINWRTQCSGEDRCRHKDLKSLREVRPRNCWDWQPFECGRWRKEIRH